MRYLRLLAFGGGKERWADWSRPEKKSRSSVSLPVEESLSAPTDIPRAPVSLLPFPFTSPSTLHPLYSPLPVALLALLSPLCEPHGWSASLGRTLHILFAFQGNPNPDVSTGTLFTSLYLSYPTNATASTASLLFFLLPYAPTSIGMFFPRRRRTTASCHRTQLIG